MPTPKYYSRLAIAVSAALASMVYSSHAAWVDVDSLPSSGLVSSLPPELQALIPAQANAHFAKPARCRIMFINGMRARFPFMATG